MAVSLTSYTSRNRPIRDQATNGLGLVDAESPQPRGRGSPGLSLHIAQQPSANGEGSPSVANRMHVNRSRLDRGQTEPLLIGASPPSPSIYFAKATSHSPGSPSSRRSPLAARNILAHVIAQHQKREALASSSPTNPESPSFTLPQQTFPNPTSPPSPSKGQAQENPSPSSSATDCPQSPLLVRKHERDAVNKETMKESSTSPMQKNPLQTSVVNGDMSNGISSTNGEVKVEDLEDYSPSPVQERKSTPITTSTAVNGGTCKAEMNGTVDAADDEKDTHKAMAPVGNSQHVRSQSSTLQSSESLELLENANTGIGNPPERSTSSPDLPNQDLTVEGPSARTSKARTTSPPASLTKKGKFQSWFKRGSRQEAAISDTAQVVQESLKNGEMGSGSAPTSPTVISPDQGKKADSPSKKQSNRISAKLPNFFRRERRSSKEDILVEPDTKGTISPHLHASASVDCGLDSSAKRESTAGGLPKRHSTGDLLDESQPSSTRQGKDGSKNNGEKREGRSEAPSKILGPSAKVVKCDKPVSEDAAQKAAATRGRRTSMYEPRPLAFSRVKSPATSTSSGSSTPTKSGTVKASSKSTGTDKAKPGATSGGVKRVPSTASTTSRKSEDSLKATSATSLRPASAASQKSSSATSLHGHTGGSFRRTSSADSTGSKGPSGRPTSAPSTKVASSLTKSTVTSKTSATKGRPTSATSTKTAASPFLANSTAKATTSTTGGRRASDTNTKTASSAPKNGAKPTKSSTAGRPASAPSTKTASSSAKTAATSKASGAGESSKRMSTLRNFIRSTSPKPKSSPVKSNRSKSLTATTQSQLKGQTSTTAARKASLSSNSAKTTVTAKAISVATSKAPLKPSSVTAMKPPSGPPAVRRRESYAMAVTVEMSGGKSVRKNSSILGPIPVENAPPEVGPQPTTLIEVELIDGPLEEAATLTQVPATETQRPSTSSLLDSVIEEGEERDMVDGQGVSTQKGSRQKASKTTQKIIERPIGPGTTGRRRSVVTVTPSPKTANADAKPVTGTRRYSTAAAQLPGMSHTLGAGRRQSVADAGNRSATLGGRRMSAYSRRDALQDLNEEGEEGERKRKSSLEGIKGLLRSSAKKTLGRRKRRSSGEGLGEKQSSTNSQDTFEEFEKISRSTSDARLKHQDHRLAVRPKMRRPPSTAHLKDLQEREGVSSEIKPRRAHTVDNTLWSTYLGKRDMDPTAEAGLALKIDFSAVKLRRTVSELREEGEGSEVAGGPSAVVEYSNPSKLLLHVKGRRHVQTVLVEPSSSSLNSGDVFILVTERELIQWVGAKANILEKAKGTELLERISKKKELGCKCVSFMTVEEAKADRKASVFWELLGGKGKVKPADVIATDEMYEKEMPSTTVVYELQGEGERAKFVVIKQDCHQRLSKEMLDTTKMYVLDFMTEVYIWIGKHSKIAQRKKALILARELFDAGYYPSPFERRPSSARRSSRGSLRSMRRSSKGELRASMGKGKAKAGASAAQVAGLAASVTGGPVVEKIRRPRPKWALFNRINEGSETILLREKFSDWPDDSRIIKMKGHVSSGEVLEMGPMPDPVPIDPKVLLVEQEPFKGLVLDGENVYRGKGRMRPDDVRGSKVATVAVKQWWIKEYDHSLLSEEDVGIFYSAEGYVIRWAFRATILRCLEGLSGVSQNQSRGNRPVTWHVGDPGAVPGLNKAIGGEDPFLEDSADEDDDGNKKPPVTESGGTDRCAYFFWQGIDCTITEKGAAALMTVELDEERGPQVRVPQGEEMPAFFSIFDGGMVVLDGKWEANPLLIDPDQKPCRLFCVRGLNKSEACLLEIPWTKDVSMAEHLRSRSCFVLHHLAGSHFYLWHGSKSTTTMQSVARRALVRLRKRFEEPSEVTVVKEGEEPSVFWTLMEGEGEYMSLAKSSRALEFTPRVWLLSSSTGEFTANEVLYPCRNGMTDPFPILQSDLYTAEQPALFLLDVHYEVYVWVGWWPVQADARFREKNQFTGDAYVRFTRDKRLAMETAINYAKACGRIIEPRVYVVFAGYEHAKFINYFPFWQVDVGVVASNKQHVTVRYSHRSEAADELQKLSRDRYTLKELQARPLPEGVDPKRLETYLGEEEFNSVFNMSKDEFAKLPSWRQTSLKKNAGLF